MSAARQSLPTRRRLLGGAGRAGLVAAAAAAGTITGAGTAQAGTDGDVVLGADNPTSLSTSITNSADTSTDFGFQATVAGVGTALWGVTDSGYAVLGSCRTGRGVGVAGSATGPRGLGVVGTSGAGTGVSGSSQTGVGVVGTSQSHWGVAASSNTDTALQAQSQTGVGVVAVSGMTGVYAQTGAHDGFAITHDAVRGYTDAAAGAGVRGENFFGGAGVHGIGSTGVVAEASGAAPGIALSVRGPARFSLSGLVTIAPGSSKGTVNGVKLSATSMVLATLQEHLSGVFIAAAVPDASTSSITVYLSKSVTQSAKVAWFVLN